jgi:hypothetical protein
MYEHTLTSGQVAMLFLAFIITLLAYLLKDIPVIGKAWYVIKIFWIVVFGTLLFNFAKKEIKEWWYKD